MPETSMKPLTWFKETPQLRKDLGSEADLLSLGRSLQVRQLCPLGAMADGELIWGFRRLKAAWLVGMKQLQVTVFTEPLSEVEKACAQLTENIHRLDMSPFEKWNACEELRRLNTSWSAKDLADYLKLDPSAVTKLLSPSKCIPEWQAALKEGRVGISDCYTASLASRDEQPNLLELKLSGATREKLRRAFNRANPKPPEDIVRSARITIPLETGAKVVVSGPRGLSLSDVVDALVECLEAARKGLKERLDAKTFQSVMRDKSSAVCGRVSDA